MKLDEKLGLKGLVVLFDLNGTLVSRNKHRAPTVRPGAEELKNLAGCCNIGGAGASVRGFTARWAQRKHLHSGSSQHVFPVSIHEHGSCCSGIQRSLNGGFVSVQPSSWTIVVFARFFEHHLVGSHAVGFARGVWSISVLGRFARW